jgi:hypothetical protein
MARSLLPCSSSAANAVDVCPPHTTHDSRRPPPEGETWEPSSQHCPPPRAIYPRLHPVPRPRADGAVQLPISPRYDANGLWLLEDALPGNHGERGHVS